MRPPFPPVGYRRIRVGGREVVAWDPVVGAVEGALAEADSLYDWVAKFGRHAGRGRGEIHEARLGSERAAVRRYRRGGWMRPLGDRYLDRVPRPFRELEASTALRDAGVPTPRVLAAVVARAPLGYRGEIAVEWLEPGHDLELLLRPGAYPSAVASIALRAAGRCVGLAHRAGLDHPDLQYRNLFVRPLPDGGWEAFLLDLDRAHIHPGRPDRAKKKTSRGSSVRSTRRAAPAGSAGPMPTMRRSSPAGTKAFVASPPSSAPTRS
jgi:tRNA A-37 threonylcarbamoyl transferase component Bud32